LSRGPLRTSCCRPKCRSPWTPPAGFFPRRSSQIPPRPRPMPLRSTWRERRGSRLCDGLASVRPRRLLGGCPGGKFYFAGIQWPAPIRLPFPRRFRRNNMMSADALILLYVVSLLAAISCVAIYSDVRRRRFGPASSADRVFRCHRCGLLYTDDADVERSRCSQCGWTNDAIEF